MTLQKSFLDAWLKGDDNRGWLKGPNAPGGVPSVSLLLRAGNPGYNFTEAERTFPRRTEKEWPISRTEYTHFYLNLDRTLTREKPSTAGKLNYKGFDGGPLQFKTAPFEKDTEITGHIIANLVVSIEFGEGGEIPKDMDLFVTLRHFDAEGSEIYYTGVWRGIITDSLWLSYG